jgi:hypothetical protein
MEAAAITPRHKVKKQINLFYCAECEELALKIAATSDAIQLRSITWRYAAPASPLPSPLPLV